MFEIKSHRHTYPVIFTDFDSIPYVEDCIAIVDSNINDLYEGDIASKFDVIHVIEAVEENKTLAYCMKLIDTLLTLGVKKNTTLVAIGGGVTQDITSFVASILYRGVSWTFIPTTLLAQADSCIGSKTSINHGNVKNLVGTFYPPASVFCDVAFLATLPNDDIDSGIGEMLHYFMLSDSPYLSKIDKNNLTPCIEESLRLKKEMVEKDEFDRRERRIFNYGHTFGHALEALSQYELNHGLAVTVGMDLANFISYRMGIISKESLDYLSKHISFNMPDYKIHPSRTDEYMEILLKDKKNIGYNLVCVLPYGIGDYRVTTISNLKELSDTVKEYFSHYYGLLYV